MNALNYEEAVHKLLKVQLQGRRGIILLFACLQRYSQGTLERTSQHGHRVLFPRAFIFRFLWARQRTFLQAQARMERVF